MKAMRFYTWKIGDAPRLAWEQLTDFAKEVAQRLNAPATADDIADAAVTIDKLGPFPFLSLMRDTALSIASGGTTTLVPMTLTERSSGKDAPLFDGTNGRAIVSRDGLYRVSALLHCAPSAAPAGSILEVIVTVDGDRICLGAAAASLNAGVAVYAAKTVRLLKSQAVELRCYQNTGAPQALSTQSDRRPRLQIEYVGGL